MHASCSAIPAHMLTALLAIGQALEQTADRADSALRPVCAHLLGSGQRIRSRILLTACGDLADCTLRDRAVQVATAIELLHTATLIQDDIFDEAHLRRGRPATHRMFGNSLATLASDWLLMESLRIGMNVHVDIADLLLRAAQEMAIAEAKELHPTDVTTLAGAHRHLCEVALGKTGALFAAALSGATLLTSSSSVPCACPALLGRELGLTFQLIDDCNDIFAHSIDANKDVRQDLSKGQLTFPILAALERLDPITASRLLTQLRCGSLNDHSRMLLIATFYTSSFRLEMSQLLASRFHAHAEFIQRTGFNSDLIPILREICAGCCVESQPQR